MKFFLIASHAFKTNRLIKCHAVLTGMGVKPNVVYWNRVVDEVEVFKRIDSLGLKEAVGINVGPAPYGQGWKGALKKIQYNLAVFNFLKKQKEKIVVHAIDFDSALPVFFLKLVKRKQVFFIYDIADFIETFHSNIPSLMRKIVKSVSERIMLRSDIIIIPDKNRFVNIPKRFQHKVLIVNNAPDINKGKVLAMETDVKVDPNKINIIYYGVLSNDRGLRHLTNFIKSNSDRFHVYIAGWGELASEIQSLQLPGLSFLGSLSTDEVLRVLVEMDVSYICYDPVYEHNRLASPNKIYEAILFNKSMIVAENTTIDKLIESHRIGVVAKYEEDDISAVLQKLDKATLAVFARNCIALETEYRWEPSKEILEKLYLGLIGDGARQVY